MKTLPLLNWLPVLFLLLLFMANSVAAQCDDSIQPNDNALLAYKKRGNQCEGFYQSKVASLALNLVGFIKGSFRYLPDNREVITLSLPNHTTEEVHIQATGIPLDLYYRMDSRITGNEKFEWSVKDVLLLNTRSSSSRNIGILGYILKDEEKTYVPILASSKLTKPTDSQEIIMILRADTAIDRVRWRKEGEKEYRRLPLKRPIKAGRPIKIVLPAEMKGRFNIEVQVKEERRADWRSLKVNVQI